MGIRGTLTAFVVGMTLITAAPAVAEPSAWATDRSGLVEADPSLYLVRPRAQDREHAFLSPDGSLLCGMPVTQFSFAFCAPTHGEFPAALGMPAAAPGASPTDARALPREIRVNYRPDTPPKPLLSYQSWWHSFWQNLAPEQVRVLPANSSLSANDSTCWTRGTGEVHCVHNAGSCWSDSNTPSADSCVTADDEIGFAISPTRYELFSTRR